MMPLARLWTWTGHLFIPFAIGWSVYILNGLADLPPPLGVLVSRAYWGLLITIIVGNTLTWTLALYIRAAKEMGASLLVPPNTTFEDNKSRNSIISIGTIIVFILSIILGLAVFGARYAKSEIHEWNNKQPVQSGFWASRASAHEAGCKRPPCFAVGQRVDSSGATIFGVNEYILYLTDGGLAVLILTIIGGVGFLTNIILRKRRPFIL